jgi:REP element-mobilizing transposase RayT
MNQYNPNIHHRRSIRLKGYDYSQEGLYFITICCQDRVWLFGEVVDKVMILNDAGKIANACWLEIPNHFPNAILHEHIVMPNHIHGIIELGKDVNDGGVGVEGVEGVENLQPQPQPQPQRRNEFQKIIPRSIGSIVKGVKIGVTKWFRQNTSVKTVWQRDYYDIIIRNDQAYQRISDYIVDNPAKWKEDKFFKR